MTLTPAQIVAWHQSVNRLSDVVAAWAAFGNEIDSVFDKYVAAVEGVQGDYWEGRAAEAAQDRARADRKTAGVAVDDLNDLGRQVTTGFHAIDTPLRRSYIALNALQDNNFRVDDKDIRKVTDPTPSPARQLMLEELADDLISGADAAEKADADLAKTLSAAADNFRGVFASPQTLGYDQGVQDTGALTGDPGSLTAAQVQRLVDAGTLTPQQLSDLHAGKDVQVSSSQMAYLNTISRSFDGKSPEQIEAVLDQLPPDAHRAVSQALQIVSNPQVTSSLTTADAIVVPARGDATLLPNQMVASMMRPDLVVSVVTAPGGVPVPTTALNGVADNQAVARIAGAAGPQYQQGSSLDRGLMGVGQEYLHAQVQAEQDPDQARYLTVDGRLAANSPVTEPIFHAVAADKAALDAAVSGSNGPGFVNDLLTHQWTDHGQAASGLFQFAPGADTPTNPGDPGQVVDATRMGHIMSVVGQTAGSNDEWQVLSHVPGTNESVGQLNPALLQQISHSMSPYVSDLAGGGQHLGFDTTGAGQHSDSSNLPGGPRATWIDPDGNQSYRGAANVFSLMDTDAGKGGAGDIFNGAAMQHIMGVERAFAATPSGPGAPDISTVGTLHGLMDSGLQQQIQTDNTNTAHLAQQLYARKSDIYDAAKAVLNTGIGKGLDDPFATIANTAVNAGNDPLKTLLCGTPPPPAQTAAVPAPDFDHDAQNILAQRQAQGFTLPPNIRNDYGWAFDNNGNVLDYNTADPKAHANVNDYQDMAQRALTTDPLNPIDPYQKMHDAYANVRADYQ